jgi:hypothetical protein
VIWLAVEQLAIFVHIGIGKVGKLFPTREIHFSDTHWKESQGTKVFIIVELVVGNLFYSSAASSKVFDFNISIEKTFYSEYFL